jgi:ribosomal protein S27E
VPRAVHHRPANSYPRITVHCAQCGNEFNVNVLRFRDRETVECQICGQVFPEDLGAAFANALYEMFTVKHHLEEKEVNFDISFIYKSTFKQPPGPYPFEPGDFEESPL